MRRNRVWIAAVAGFVLSFANLVYAQNVTPVTNNSDAMVDVLKTLETKGVITHEEFEALKAKVTKDEQKAAEQQQTAVQQAVQQSAPQLKSVAMPQDQMAADNNVTMMSNGVGFHTGRFDVTITGEVNGFYVQDRADNNPTHISCLLCEASVGGRPSGAIRSGLLPGDLSFKISTQEHGWDVAVFFGMWPAIQNSATVGTVEDGVNGTAALATPGIDFRQQFATLGHAHFGTLKIGRDLGLFGQEAILNDMTLLGAGSPGLSSAVTGVGANQNPGNVTLGRIGVGYVYTDFIPQITYTTPSLHGLQGAFGVFTPYDDPLFASTTAYGNGQPSYQGKLTYAMGKHAVKAKFWSNFVTEREEPQFKSEGSGARATGVDYGFSGSWHGLGLVGYGYNGWGLGQAGLFWDGLTSEGTTGVTTRASSGYYFQPSYSYKKFFFGYSYGQSILTAANATDLDYLSTTGQAVEGFRANSSHIAQFRFAVTKWDNLVAEYTHTRSEVQHIGTSDSGTPITTSDSVALGTIVFF